MQTLTTIRQQSQRINIQEHKTIIKTLQNIMHTLKNILQQSQRIIIQNTGKSFEQLQNIMQTQEILNKSNEESDNNVIESFKQLEKYHAHTRNHTTKSTNNHTTT